MMFKVEFDILHKGCWGSEISLQFPHANFSSVDVRWVQGDVAHLLVAEVLKAEGKGEQLKDIVPFLKKDKYVARVEVLHEEENKIYVRTLTKHTEKHKQFSNIFFDNHLFPIAPVRFEKGYEKWTLATVDKGNIAKVYNYLHKKYKTKIAYIKEDTLNSTLTAKQQEAINYAKLFGYYEWPRKKSATEIAALIGIPKTVFLSHLRKAEHKIILDKIASP